MNSSKKTNPQVYYALHMSPGVVQYTDTEGAPYRILVGPEAISRMNPTFSGKPIFTKHVDFKDLEEAKQDPDGYVVDSFFNQADGHTWTKIMAVTDRANEAIRGGWRVSNAYMPKSWEAGGKWHDVDYARELLDAEFTHLAIINDPRYEESIVLTPEQFKAYNAQKQSEMQALTNSKGDSSMSILKFFKKTPVETPADIESAVVTLKSGKEITIGQLINAADDDEEKIATEDKEPMNSEKKNEGDSGAPAMAKMEEIVSIGGEQMTLSELCAKYVALSGERANAAEEAKKKEEDEAKEKQNAADKEKADKEEADKKQEELKNSKHFDKLIKAPSAADSGVVETIYDQVKRGKERY